MFLSLLSLYLEFFKIGLFAIGGGLATLPFLINLTQTHPQWMSLADISNMIAISESTPGPIGINMATFVGNNVGTAISDSMFGGVVGGIVATLGEVSPSIIVILIVARVLSVFKDNKWVKYAFYGLRAVVIALIANAAIQVYRVALFMNGTPRWLEIGLFAVLMTLMLKFKKISPLIWLICSAVLGIIFQLSH